MTMQCHDCECPGEEIGARTKGALPDGHFLLFPLEFQLYCLPCLWKRESVCLNCAEETDELKQEQRCQAKPLLCAECLSNPKTTHKYECYSSGCMTVEEFAEEAQAMLEDGVDGDEVFYLNDDDEDDDDEDEEEQ